MSWLEKGTIWMINHWSAYDSSNILVNGWRGLFHWNSLIWGRKLGSGHWTIQSRAPCLSSFAKVLTLVKGFLDDLNLKLGRRASWIRCLGGCTVSRKAAGKRVHSISQLSQTHTIYAFSNQPSKTTNKISAPLIQSGENKDVWGRTVIDNCRGA